MPKKPEKTDQAVSQLIDIINELRNGKDQFFPPERKLCEQLNISRVTLRRAITILEERNILQSGSKGRLVVSPGNIETKGKIVFYTYGYERIINPAWNRLWTKLSGSCRQWGYDAELRLLSDENPVTVKKPESENEFIILTSFPKRYSEKMFKLIEEEKNVIATHESYIGKITNVVALDNYATGVMAAQELLVKNVSRPGFIGLQNNDIAFQKRASGFIDTMKQNAIDVEEFWFSGGSLGSFMINALEGVKAFINSGIDSLFWYSDEGVNVVYEIISQSYRIAQEFSLVTVAGSHQALANDPPVTAISHATAMTCTAIFQLIENLQNETRAKENIILVKPSIYKGRTV